MKFLTDPLYINTFKNSTENIAIIDEEAIVLLENKKHLSKYKWAKLPSTDQYRFEDLFALGKLNWNKSSLNKNIESFEFNVEINEDPLSSIISFKATLLSEGDKHKFWLIQKSSDSEKEHLIEQLRSYKKLLSEIEKMVGIGHWRMDMKTMKSSWSGMIYEIHELPLDSSTGADDILPYYHPESRELVLETVRKSLKEKRPFAFEGKLNTKTGREKWVKTYGSPTIVDGEIIALEGILVDITELKKAQEGEQKISQTFDLFFEHSDHIICLHNPDGTYLKISPSITKISGYKPEELLYKNPYDLIYPEDKKKLEEEAHKELLAKRTPKTEVEYRFLHKDGHYIWLHSHTIPILDNNGEVEFLVSNSSIIDKRKKVERELEELLAQIKQKVEEQTIEIKEVNKQLEVQSNALDKAAILSATNPDGEFIYVNDNFIEISGFSKKELLGSKHSILNSGYHSDEFFKDMWDTLISGNIWQGEICNKKKNGDFYWVASTIYPVLDENDAIIEFRSIRQDITATKKLTQDLNQRKLELERVNEELNLAYKDLKTFSYTVSHDLKAPVRTVNGFGERMMKEYESVLDDRGKRWLNFIIDNGKHMDTLINDILSYSKISQEKPSAVEINTNDMVEMIYQELKEMYKEYNHIQFNYQELPHIKMDRNMAYSIWLNLLENAVKYSKDNEEIIVDIEHRREGDHYIFSVEDNGLGLDESDFEKIFEPFKRLHNRAEFEGTGIGLATVRKIAEKHHGYAKALKKEGRGSKFEFAIRK